jgi:hypothetical protein
LPHEVVHDSFDLTGGYDVNDKTTVYADVLNLFDAGPMFNPANYAGGELEPDLLAVGHRRPLLPRRRSPEVLGALRDISRTGRVSMTR